MKSPLLYILEVLFCSGLLLAFYRLLLVRKVSFRACRRISLGGHPGARHSALPCPDGGLSAAADRRAPG